MKFIILFLLIILSTAHSYAQTNVKDSLKILLEKEKQDTSRVMLLVKVGMVYRTIKPDTSLFLGVQALSLSKRIRFIKGEALSLGMMGNAYRIVGNRPKAMEAYLQALKMNEKINNLRGISENLMGIGIIYNGLEDYNQAIDYFLKAKELDEQLDNKNAFIPINLGSSYFQLKQYDSARVYIQQGYEVASKNNQNFSKGAALSLIGQICSETGQKKLALEYYRLSIPYLKLAEDYRGISSIFLNIAKLFENEGQKDSALFYASHAFEIGRGSGFTDRVLNASTFLSSFYKNNGNTDSAFFYLEIATVANDTLFKQQRINQLYTLAFDEKHRQTEIAAAELKAKAERKHNLQLVAIAIALITFILLFFAFSRSIIVKTKFIEFFGVLGLLAVFEFINLFIHPYLANATNDSAVLMLLILIAIGALLVPLHHKLEKWMTKVMVQKNKKIRLAAARKTIEQLEDKAANLSGT